MEEIIINNIKVNCLEPTKQNFTNKNNKFSAKGYYNEVKVKVFEVFDQYQGNLREFISNNKNLSTYFPKLITYDKKYIVEEWINGRTLKNINKKNYDKISLSKELNKIIDIMWSTKYDRKVFDYIDYIHNRVNKKNTLKLDNVPKKINHNDLSLDNIILSSEGIKIIDNEFLGCNSGWILNYRNSFLDENFKYREFVSDEMLDKLWDVRKEWSKLKKKNKLIKKLNLNDILRKIFKI